MNKLFYILCGVLFAFSPLPVQAEDDPYAEYLSDIRKEADAQVKSVYNAWGNNMAYRISNGLADGIVIEGEGDYADGKIHADGVGNVVIDKDAIVGPIINRTDISNTTVIMNPNRNKW